MRGGPLPRLARAAPHALREHGGGELDPRPAEPLERAPGTARPSGGPQGLVLLVLAALVRVRCQLLLQRHAPLLQQPLRLRLHTQLLTPLLVGLLDPGNLLLLELLYTFPQRQQSKQY